MKKKWCRFLYVHIGISFYNVRIYLKQCFLIVCKLQNISDFFLGHKIFQIVLLWKWNWDAYLYPFCSEKENKMFLRQGLVALWAALSSLYGWGRPWTTDPPTSTSHVLLLQLYAMPGESKLLKYLLWNGPGFKGSCCQADDLSFIPRAHIVKRENGFLQAVLWPSLCSPTHTHTHKMNTFHLLLSY